MSTRTFRGLPHILELQCTGQPLDSDTDLFSMTLYTLGNTSVVASVNLKTGECLTSSTFSSCVINERDSRKTQLKTLVIGLKQEERRGYGCNLTSLKSGAFGNIISWSFVVSGKGK
nr:hypothetical protein BaRGS_015735 [Batillaria attramentaria]